MKRLKPCVLLLIFLFSCTKTPKDIIPREQMVNVLTDVHLATAFAANYNDMDTIRQRTSTYLNAVYKRHKIDSAKFNKSLKYYSESPALFNEMYEQVDKILAKMTDSITKAQDIESKRIAALERRKAQLTRDSLARVKNSARKRLVLKPEVPAIWPFKAYHYSVKKVPGKTSRTIKKK